MMSYFIVSSVSSSGDTTSIIGRVASGSLKTGMTIVGIERNGELLPQIINESRINSIEAYRRSVTLLGDGMTGLVVVKSCDSFQLQEGDLIRFSETEERQHGAVTG
jgi:translation elongation factor EF-1alpha